MTNRVLDEYLARVRAALATIPDAEREAVLDDMRGHLEQAIADRMAATPEADLAAVTLEEMRAFGDPEEIAAAHGAKPSSAPSRPSRRWIAYAALVLVAILAVALVYDLAAERPEALAPYARTNNGLVDHTGFVNDTFEIPPDASDLVIVVTVRQADEDPTGCAGVRITDGRGTVVLDEWSACGDIHNTLRFQPVEAGTWRVEIDYRHFTGNLEVHTSGHR